MSDPALYWNTTALEANRIDHTGAMAARNQRGPTLSSRALAMVHVAMHDAYFGLVPRGAPLNPENCDPILPSNQIILPSPASRDDVIAAISQAAFVVLNELYPSQRDRFDVALSGALAAISSNVEAAAEFGIRVGRNVIADRFKDGSEVSKAAMFSWKRGHHRPDPFNEEQGLLGQCYGETRHFVMAAHQPLSPPPGHDGAALDEQDPLYLRHYKEVMSKGHRNGSARTADESAIGTFWAYDGAAQIGTPPRLYNQIVTAILADINKEQTADAALVNNLRLLMLVNVAMAEAAIDAWHYKYVYDLWRPVIGIRERGDGLGPDAGPVVSIDADADPFWEPVGAPSTNTQKRNFTPHFPAYPSGHATFGGAVFEMVRLFLKVPCHQADTIGFSFVSDELNGLSHDADGTRRTRHARRYKRLIDAMYENAVSRVYLGVHWRFDGTTATDADGLLTQSDAVGGVPLGRTIAQGVYGILAGSTAPDLDAFSVQMSNHLSFSNPATPTIPSQDKGFETLTVRLNGDVLTIADQGPAPHTIYARKIGRRGYSTEFKILAELPEGVKDATFFKAQGRAVVSRIGGRLRLYAAGTDSNSGKPNGWVFEASEQ
ncbi:phosphatase PAP2 family protein [Bradyrhizobium sp. 83002]|uniref:vanadium-dependent haloperoxidase n=1 Tax=Bradyrhizobium aeschynomenes TaxID=2734909 RepID=UPI00155312BE|nr:vanadium-dependent haloperoxidase [Bradyrhizobium aeschynomenes]NPU14080.1 phosphatase PAP2 family protein [Bradyrhizobium aeschynomenes]